MTRDEFIELTGEMIDTYGVRSYRINVEYDGDDDNADLWFECVECGDPILFEDYGNDSMLEAGYCPICGAHLAGNPDDNWFDDERENEDEDN